MLNKVLLRRLSVTNVFRLFTAQPCPKLVLTYVVDHCQVTPKDLGKLITSPKYANKPKNVEQSNVGHIVWSNTLDSLSVDADLDDVIIWWNPPHPAGYTTVISTSDIHGVTPAVHSLSVYTLLLNCFKIYQKFLIDMFMFQCLRSLD